uniref:DNA helicase n=1 Tax=Heterorhabditis bacteriophora TaxID=37862 RepID=A0A1I7XVH6_HETBA
MFSDGGLLFLIDKYSWLSDMYVIDHFVEGNWGKMPNSWRLELEEYEAIDWASFLDISSPLRRPLPLSLYCLRHLIKLLTIDRKAVRSSNEIALSLGFDSLSELQDNDSLSSALYNELKIRVKLKKEHEICRVLDVIRLLKNSSSQSPGFDTIIDVGAGLGHLSRFLAMNLTDVNVRAIESDRQLVESSSLLDLYISRRAGGTITVPQRLNEYVTSETKDEVFSEGKNTSALILGLHPCGNLSPSIIRIFNNLPSASVIMLLGCCYHKLNDGYDKLFHRKLDEINQFVPYSHKVHCYRAALEWLIVNCGWIDNSQQKRHLGLKGVKKAHEMTFMEYAQKALFGKEDLWIAIRKYVGTGKTLCLLCAVLGWIQKQKMSLAPTMQEMMALSAGVKKDASSGIRNSRYLFVPRVFYCSRTHSQLAQVVRELNKTTYKIMATAIIGSRDQFCIHDRISKESDNQIKVGLLNIKKNLLSENYLFLQSIMCRNVVSKRTCSYYNQWDKMTLENLNQISAESGNVPDIEEIVATGRKHRYCPFFRNRQMNETAELVLLPYNYLIDPQLRRQNNIDLNGSIIIFDEAHNLDNCSQAFGSDMDKFNRKDKDPAFNIGTAAQVLNMLFELETHIENGYDDKIGRISSDFPGKKAAEFLNDEGNEYAERKGKEGWKKRDNIRESSSMQSENLGSLLNGKNLEKIRSFILVVYSSLSQEVHFSMISEQKITLKYWCFTAGIAMKSLKAVGVRNIIVTSGTLSPLSNFIHNLGISSDEYVSGIAESLLSMAITVPQGILVFFASYSLMNQMINELKKRKPERSSYSYWQMIIDTKTVVVEPRNKQELSVVRCEFTQGVRTEKGAMFFAVCRGKVSYIFNYILLVKIRLFRFFISRSATIREESALKSIKVKKRPITMETSEKNEILYDLDLYPGSASVDCLSQRGEIKNQPTSISQLMFEDLDDATIHRHRIDRMKNTVNLPDSFGAINATQMTFDEKSSSRSLSVRKKLKITVHWMNDKIEKKENGEKCKMKWYGKKKGACTANKKEVC